MTIGGPPNIKRVTASVGGGGGTFLGVVGCVADPQGFEAIYLLGGLDALASAKRSLWCNKGGGT